MTPIGTAELDQMLTRCRGLVEYPRHQGITPAGVRICPDCHPDAHFKIVYERPGGELLLACSTCGFIRARIAVGRI